MNEKQKDLSVVLSRKKYSTKITWDNVDSYARQYKKYDSLTLREIDEVFRLLSVIK